MNQQPRVAPRALLAVWLVGLAIVGLGIHFFGPAASQIALLSVSDGMTITYGSIYLMLVAVATVLTLLVVQWSLVGTDGFFELGQSNVGAGDDFRYGARTAMLGGYALIGLLTCYFLYVRLGKTLICRMVHDSFIFFDGAHGIVHGQTQHIDFHTPMGFFCNLLPYWGFRMSGELAGSMEWAGLISGCLLLAVGVPIIASRLTAAAAIPFTIYLCLLSVVPLDVETQPEGITHAMFFNRLGWAAVTLLFLVILEPRRRSKVTLAVDSVCVGAILFFLCYLKMSYFAVAVAFLPLLFLQSAYNRRVACIAFALLLAGIGIVEVVYGLNGPYLRDLQMAIHASGANRGSMVPKFIANIKEFALLAGAFALAWPRSRSKWTYMIYVGYVGYVAAAGLLIIDQNTQSFGVICLVAALMACQEWVRRRLVSAAPGDQSSDVLRVKNLACLGLALLFMIQPIIYRLTSITMIRSAVTQVDPQMPDGLHGFVFVDDLWEHFCEGKTRDPITSKVIPALPRAAMKAESDYVDNLLDGLKLLKAAGVSGKHVTVFDFVTPFTSLLSLEPPVGGHTAIDYGRTMGDTDYPPAEELLSHVDYLMVPKEPIMPHTTRYLLRTYQPYIDANFEKSNETPRWILWQRRPSSGAGG